MPRTWIVPVAAITLLAQAPAAPDWPRLEAETMQHFQALLRLDTSNPPGNEKLATDYLKQVLDREGIATQIFALAACSAYHAGTIEGGFGLGRRPSHRGPSPCYGGRNRTANAARRDPTAGGKT